MKEHLNKLIASAKAFWAKQNDKQKKIIGFGAGGALMLIIAVTVFINLSGNGYKVLYPGLSSQETAEVYATLQEMAVTPQVNSKGEVMVPRDQWDNLLVELAGKGYPKSVPAYGMFLDNASMTSTEYEKKKVYVFSLQDRLQVTLKRLSGVKDAVVTINIPEESGFVWEQSSETASAAVVITMNPGTKLSPERVSAIKNLVAYGLPGMMEAENVKVVDASTGLEIDAAKDEAADGVDYKRLEYERTIQKSIEDDIRRLLAPRYGADGVTVVAKVTLNYDKIVTESKEVLPQADGKGVPSHYDEQYSIDGKVNAGGVVGEENNTDIPGDVPEYQNQTQNGTGETTNYQRSVDFDIGYVLKQVENGQGVLTQASVAVVVNEPDFTTERQNTLIDLISKAVSIEPAYIRVSNLDYVVTDRTVGGGLGDLLSNPMVLLLAGGLLLLILLIIVVMLLVRRSSKRRKAEQEALAAQEGRLLVGGAGSEDPEMDVAALQQEIEDHKRMLQKNAEANSKESAMVNEIREFAKENPEITASIIRSMLKEEE